MSNEVTTQGTFEDRMKARIRDSIGDLMSDEDLAKIIDQGIRQTFFQSRPNPNGYGGSIEPLINEIVKGVLQSKVNAAVEKWFAEHPDEIQTVIDETIKMGVGGCLLQTVNMQFQGALHMFGMEVQRLQQNLANRGY